MKRTRIIGLAVAAVFAPSAVAASAASAHIFNVKPIGGTFPAAILGTGGAQKFSSGFGTFTCNTAKSTGEVKKAEELTTEATVLYSGCTDSIGHVIDTIKALYEFSADELVSILSPIVIAFLGSANCYITLLKQSGLGGIKFKNNTAKTELTVESKTTGIKQTGTGGFCTNGTLDYTGNVTDKLDGGGELFWS